MSSVSAGGVGLRPRFWSMAASPRSRCRLQSASMDEYKPSRRNNAPSSPLCVQASAWRTMDMRYSAVKPALGPLQHLWVRPRRRLESRPRRQDLRCHRVLPGTPSRYLIKGGELSQGLLTERAMPGTVMRLGTYAC